MPPVPLLRRSRYSVFRSSASELNLLALVSARESSPGLTGGTKRGGDGVRSGGGVGDGGGVVIVVDGCGSGMMLTSNRNGSPFIPLERPSL